MAAKKNPAKEPGPSDVTVEITATQVRQLEDLLSFIVNPGVQYTGDLAEMANAVIGNSQQRAQQALAILGKLGKSAGS